MTRRFWSPHEKGILKRYYPREGAKGVHRRLKNRRTMQAIFNKALSLGLNFGDVPGYLQTNEVHGKTEACGLESHSRIIREATRDGVLETLANGRRRVSIVPIEWADEYVERLAAEEAKGRRTQRWLGSGDVCTRLGCAHSSLMKALRGETDGAIRAAVEGVRTVRLGEGYGSEVRWHPGDVEQAARKYRFLQRQEAA